jgi:hypothetical protein
VTSSPYAKQPRVGWLIECFVGPALVVYVHQHGTVIEVRDRLGRKHMLTRHEDGWWWVLERDPDKIPSEYRDA